MPSCMHTGTCGMPSCMHTGERFEREWLRMEAMGIEKLISRHAAKNSLRRLVGVQVGASQVESSQVKSSLDESSQVESRRVESSQVESSQGQTKGGHFLALVGLANADGGGRGGGGRLAPRGGTVGWAPKQRPYTCACTYGHLVVHTHMHAYTRRRWVGGLRRSDCRDRRGRQPCQARRCRGQGCRGRGCRGQGCRGRGCRGRGCRGQGYSRGLRRRAQLTARSLLA